MLDARPSPDYHTLSPEEIRDAAAAGVAVTDRLLIMAPREVVARRDGSWYLTTTAAAAANLWTAAHGCVLLGSRDEESCERVLAHWSAEAEREAQVADRVLAAARRLDDALAGWEPPGVAVLRPTRYAARAWERYARLAARRGCALLVGMNPGPRGMMQTGVPFCDPATLGDLLGAEAVQLMLDKGVPDAEPGRWRSRRDLGGPREESGQRLWSGLRFAVARRLGIEVASDAGHAQATRAVPAYFFAVNALPVGFLDAETGRNVAASDVALPTEVRDAIKEWLVDLRIVLRPAAVVSIGAWSRDYVRASALVSAPECPLLHLRHPSPLAGSATSWREHADPVLARALELAGA